MTAIRTRMLHVLEKYEGITEIKYTDPEVAASTQIEDFWDMRGFGLESTRELVAWLHEHGQSHGSAESWLKEFHS